MADRIIYCRKGEACNFQVVTGDAAPYPPFPDQYTVGTFHVRDEWAPDSTLRIELTEADGLTLNNADGQYFVEIGATVSAAIDLDPPAEGIPLAALLRVRDPDNDEDVVGYAIPFVLLPEI